MEGVHSNTMNQMTLHTTAGCTLSQPMNATGRILTTDCDVAADSNIGCGVQDRSEASYGKGFNDARGGVYVTFFDESGISVWFFLVRTPHHLHLTISTLPLTSSHLSPPFELSPFLLIFDLLIPRLPTARKHPSGHHGRTTELPQLGTPPSSIRRDLLRYE